MASLKQRATARVSALRARRPLVDHAVRMQEHYTGVDGSQQAGAVTYFAFLSFFPVMALSFFVVGYVAHLYPGVKHDMVDVIDQVLPGIVGQGADKISLKEIQEAAGAVGILGLVGVLYSGLGWLSGMRSSLMVVFELPSREQPNFLLGKLRDLVTLALIGLVLVVSVAVSGFVSRFSVDLLDWLHLAEELSPLLKVFTVVVGLAANMVLFYAMFRLLAEPHTPTRSLWSGALLGALAFEVLKRLSGLLLASTKDQPAFQAFGIALILVVWINYFSRVVLYAAAWAHTSRAARAERLAEPAAPLQGPQTPALTGQTRAGADRAGWVAPFAAGGATALAAVAVLTRRLPKDDA